MPVVGHVLGLDVFTQEVDLAFVLVHRHLLLPLERAVRLRHEAGRADRDAHAARLVRRVHTPRVQHLIGQLRDAEHVLIRLCRQTEHEVELDAVPAALEGDAAGMEQVFLAHVFVDRIAQALRAGLRRKGQTALAHLLQTAHDVHRKIVRTQ